MQREHLCFLGNISENREYYNNLIKHLFKVAFKIDVNPHEKPSNFAYGFYLCNKDVIKYFNELLGFSFGSNTHIVRVPKIIMNSDKPTIWSAFIRGFCDSDGCLNFDKRYGNDQGILKIIHTHPRVFM